jgi:protein-S-isoprenylcysteine O-methyltransferase Ste14
LGRIGILILHLAAVLVPLLAGWGVSDARGYLEEPARMGLLLGILAGATALLVFGIDLNPLRVGGSRARGQVALLSALAAASLAVLWWLPFADRRAIWILHAPAVRWIGLGLCCAGGAIRVFALSSLGSQFSAFVTLQSRHELVEHGIYSWIRHPLYLSLLLAGPGLALVFRSQLVWPVLLGALVFVANRIAREEALLASHFGSRFLGYRARTWALVPLLY